MRPFHLLLQPMWYGVRPTFLKASPVATTTSSFTLAIHKPRMPIRGLTELTLGFVAILIVLWLPTREQLIFGPVALLMPAVLVFSTRPSANELGLSLRQVPSSLWILPAATALSA